MPHVLVADYVHPLMIPGLKGLGYRVHYAPEIERPEALRWVGLCDGIVINTKTVADAEMMSAGTNLKWIARLGSGLDIIDLSVAEARGIAVINTPEANADAVAEHVMGMLLSLVRHIVVADQEVRQGIWRREANRGIELGGRTIGIIGFGHNGSAFAARLAGWGCQILAYDKYKTDYTGDYPHVRECSRDEVLQQSEIISLHVPLTPDTRHLVDDRFLGKCRRGVILINSSRGKVVHTGALVKALQSGHVAGACLDVFENERPATFTRDEQEMYAALYAMPQVVMTPHIAGWTAESRRRIAEGVLQKVASII